MCRLRGVLCMSVLVLKIGQQILLQSSGCSFQLGICELVVIGIIAQSLLTLQARSCLAVSVTMLSRAVSEIIAF